MLLEPMTHENTRQSDCRRLIHPQLPQPFQEEQKHPWTLPNIRSYYINNLERSYEICQGTLSNGELFAFFLDSTFHWLGRDPPSRSTYFIKALVKSAEQGYVPAQAVITRVFASYGLLLSSNLSNQVLINWQLEGASSGSTIAAADLNDATNFKLSDAARDDLNKAWKSCFYYKGGSHQQIPGKVPEASEWRGKTLSEIRSAPVDKTEERDWLHPLAVWSNHVAINELLSVDQVDTNAVDTDGRTALYQACVAGSAETVRVLCAHGADASLSQYSNDVTCLHWLFTFPSRDINQLARLLQSSGADPDALSGGEIPVVNFHFPFTWPWGTPLHWAVHARNPSAVAALLRIGANPGIRNGIDPYIDDLNVRYMEAEGELNQGGYSIPTAAPEGFNVLDMAVSNHSWECLEAISAVRSESKDVLQSDEEGYTPFHRLSYHWVGRTADWTRFWYPAFEGAPPQRQHAVSKTIEALKRLGGDIDNLTAPSPTTQRRGDRPGTLTPLMLAVTVGDIDTLRALLACDSDPNIINNLGLTALSVLPESDSPLVRPSSIPLIVRTLLDHGANPNYTHPSALSPLASCIFSGSMEATGNLLDAGADPTVQHAGLNVIALLLARSSIHGRRLNHQNLQGTVINNETHIRLLFQKYLLNDRSRLALAVDAEQGTLLHYAVKAGLCDIATSLLSAGLDASAFREPVERERSEYYNYNSYARYMTWGTPLDLVLHEKLQVEKCRERGSDYLSVQDFGWILNRYECLEDLLVERGGRAMRVIGSTEGRYLY